MAPKRRKGSAASREAPTRMEQETGFPQRLRRPRSGFSSAIGPWGTRAVTGTTWRAETFVSVLKTFAHLMFSHVRFSFGGISVSWWGEGKKRRMCIIEDTHIIRNSWTAEEQARDCRAIALPRRASIAPARRRQRTRIVKGTVKLTMLRMRKANRR